MFFPRFWEKLKKIHQTQSKSSLSCCSKKKWKQITLVLIRWRYVASPECIMTSCSTDCLRLVWLPKHTTASFCEYTSQTDTVQSVQTTLVLIRTALLLQARQPFQKTSSCCQSVTHTAASSSACLCRPSRCPTLDQERSSALESSSSSSFSSSYYSSPSGRKLSSERSRTPVQAPGPWWACRPSPRRPATCCTRPAWGSKASSSRLCECRVRRPRPPPTVRWEAALEARRRSWCVPPPTPLCREDSWTRAWGAGMETSRQAAKAAR